MVIRITAIFLISLFCVTSEIVNAHGAPSKPTKNVGILLYPDFEVLDVYGPVEMWGYIPDFKIHMIAETKGPVRSAQKTLTQAEYDFTSAPELDILLVPGGIGTSEQLNNQALIDFIKKVDQQTDFTTSVCTGSALLAKAGVLDGEKATSNKRFFWMSEKQSNKVEWIDNARWVQSGKVFTSSGVSAGTDMALGLIQHLYGDRWANGIASSLEYEWENNASNDPFSPFVNRLLENQDGLVSALPTINAELNTPPGWIWLIYEDEPNLDKSSIQLFSIDEEKKAIDLVGLHSMGRDDMMIGINEELAAGEYQVEWRAEFDDSGLSKTGRYTFFIRDKQETE